jgi:5-methylcytosine-specific restriction endonuclease McrA
MKTTLTDRAVKTAKQDISDTIVPGLMLRVRPSGHKSYALRARFPGSTNPTRRTLGRYGVITLQAARAKARKWIEQLQCGIDPASVIKEERIRKERIRRRYPGQQGFYGSREWRELRYKVLARQGARCQCCGASRDEGRLMHVDHIKPRHRFPELELTLENLQVLCDECNIGKSSKDTTDWRPIEPNNVEDAR